MNDLLIQPVTDDQAVASVAALASEIWREHYTPIIGAGQVEYMLDRFQSKAAIAGQTAAGYRYYLLCLPGGEAVGYFSLEPRQGELFLSKIYVRRSCRGRGCARRAVDFIAGFAKENGLSRITLTVNKNNLASIAAYKKMGFTVYANLVTDIGGGYVMDDYGMEKRVE